MREDNLRKIGEALKKPLKGKKQRKRDRQKRLWQDRYTGYQTSHKQKSIYSRTRLREQEKARQHSHARSCRRSVPSKSWRKAILMKN